MMIYELKAGSHLFLETCLDFTPADIPSFCCRGLHGAVIRTHLLTTFSSSSDIYFNMYYSRGLD